MENYLELMSFKFSFDIDLAVNEIFIISRGLVDPLTHWKYGCQYTIGYCNIWLVNFIWLIGDEKNAWIELV